LSVPTLPAPNCHVKQERGSDQAKLLIQTSRQTLKARAFIGANLINRAHPQEITKSMPIEPFPIVPITNDMILQDEPMGSKDKCWCQLTTELGGGRWLFKQPRQQPENIEHLAEKIAYELARLIQLPCARVELAQFGGVHGSISLDVRAPGEVLVHGNEIIAGRVLGYDLHQKRHTSDHTFERIQKGILEVCTGRCKEDLNQFAGYLAFDALIANTDRHHEIGRC
jgi:hypothetical protein